MDALPINWKLIGNPANWGVIILMLVIGGFALHMLLPSMSPSQKGS